MEFVDKTLLSDNWLKIYRYDFKSGDKIIPREVVEQPDAVAVLPFDLQRQKVMLVKQFRAPCYAKTGEGMIIEACAGLVDAGETPWQAASREALEECGVRLQTGIFVARDIFASPGAMDQRKSLFLSEYAEADVVEDGGGVASEGEEIEVLELDFSTFMELEIRDLKTLVLRYALKDALEKSKTVRQ